MVDCKTVVFSLNRWSQGAARRKRGSSRAAREPHSPQSHSSFSHSLQTFRSKTASIRLTDQRKKYDCFAVYFMETSNKGGHLREMPFHHILSCVAGAGVNDARVGGGRVRGRKRARREKRKRALSLLPRASLFSRAPLKTRALLHSAST